MKALLLDGEIIYDEKVDINSGKDIDDPAAWYSQFEFFPLDEVLTEVGPALFESCISTKKFKALSKKLKTTVPKELK